MTDKVQKIREEVERLRNLHQMKYQQLDADSSMSLVECGKRNLCNELLSFIDSLQEEPKKCMYSKDDFTDEDRKVLCDGCEEECEYAQKKDPVSKVWQDASEKPEKEKLCLVLSNIDAIGGNKHLAYFVDNKETGKCGFLFGGYIGMDMVVKWAYIDDIINL